MEWLRKQFEFWPKKMTDEELNELLEEAGRKGQRKGEDLVSKEKTTRALEGGSVKTERILSPKESAEKAKQVVEKLEEKEKGKKEDKKK